MSKARELAELSRTVADSADAVAITINSDEEVTFASDIDVTGSVTATGTSVFASLDISGDIDVDGTTNLDVVDIDGAVDMASTLAVGGNITQGNGDYLYTGGGNFDIKHTTAGQNIVFSTTPSGGSTAETLRITSDGKLSKITGDLTLDVAGDIILDADGGDVRLADGGTQFARLSDGTEFTLSAMGTDKDIKFAGNDGGVAITALTLDMSAAGAATFNSSVRGTQLEAYKTNHGGDVSVAANQVGNAYENLASTASLILGATSTSTINSTKIVADHSVGATNNHVQDLVFYPVGGSSNNFEAMRISSLGALTVKNVANGHTVFNENGVDADFRVESDSNTHALFLDASTDCVNIQTAGGVQSIAGLNSRVNGAAIEFGHSNNTAGYFGTLGAQGNNGHPYLGFSTSAEFNVNTFKTYGAAGNIIVGDLSGNLLFSQVVTASAVNQTPVERMRIQQGSLVINEPGNNYDFRVESDGNANMLFVDASTNRVGVGTGSPGAPLEIRTGHTVTDVTAANTNSTLILLNSGTGDGVYNALKFAGNQQDMYIMSFNDNTVADRRLGFFLGSVAGDAVADERLSILGDGNIGIGTNSPISLDGNAAPGLTISSNGPFICLQDANNADKVNYISNNTGVMQFGIVGDNGASGKTEVAQISSNGAVFNENSADIDFRVESNLQAYMLYVDGGNDIVNFNSTQTTSQQGAGYRLDGFQREFQRDTNVLSVNQSANSNTGARTRRLTIQLHNYGPVKITIMNGGHLYNNGASFGFRETTFYVAMESTSFRINSKVDGVNAGTYASSYGVPTIAAAGSQPRCQIDFTVAAQMTCSTYVKVEGFGTSNIIGIADV